MDCLLAFLSPATIDLLTTFVNSAISTSRTKEQLEHQRHYAAIRVVEVWGWIAQRLDISLKLKVSIDTAYKSVRARAHLLLLSLIFSDRGRQKRLAAQVSLLLDQWQHDAIG